MKFMFIRLIGILQSRVLWQVRYLLFNWAYSTNHKRISINYFWFVLFAGVVGMVLATLIRLELAYPGIGVLAGDNSQYLSIVTAHGIIMVFFMAMPMLFGFFGNFLLPTQLGVHDVAFPRMNSAAFWLLPASLLALCQLICIDRRYQRINCFNVRELETLLRNKFLGDILPSNSARDIYNLPMHNLNRSFNLSNNLLLNIQSTPTSWNLRYSDLALNDTTSTLIFNSSSKKNYYSRVSLETPYIRILHPVTTNLTPFFKKFTYINNYIKTLNYSLTPRNYIKINYVIGKRDFSKINLDFLPIFTETTKYIFIKLKWFNTELLNFKNITDNENTWTNHRYLDYFNPEFVYKVKTGNYLNLDLYNLNYSWLYETVNNKSIIGYKSNWFLSENITKNLLKQGSTLKLNWFSLLLSFNFNNNLFISNKLPITSIFNSQSKQIRILNNWRFLKLTREGWRCRLLSTRHQRSLFVRYVNENEFIWIIEKNAKDLLPGWALITPFSARLRYTLLGKTDIGIAIVTITLISSMVSSANFLITYRYLSTLNNRKMRDARSFFSEALITASWMMLGANPMLILGLIMLLSDRHWKTSFFDYSGGGDTVLFQHMFWFFGHPEVYIIIIPCFGITNTLFSFYLRKRISARASLLYSLYTIAFLGFFVWGHHMYMVGLSHTTRMLYSTLTVMISVPAATKIMHWFVTFIQSSIHFELPFVLTLLFIFYFISGGISGMAVAHTGMDILFHDTFYVIGHFHVMFAGALMFSSFSAFYFYLPSIFGVRYSRTLAYFHVFYYSIGQIFTVIPMIWLGYLGMPRRVLDYPAAFGSWHSLISSAHMITVAGILAFVFMLFDSLRKQKSYTIRTFGVGRYNTRLNFYLYQIARNRYWLSKHFVFMPSRLKNRTVLYNDVSNLSYLDYSIFYFSFRDRKFGHGWLYI